MRNFYFLYTFLFLKLLKTFKKRYLSITTISNFFDRSSRNIFKIEGGSELKMKQSLKLIKKERNISEIENINFIDNSKNRGFFSTLVILSARK